MPRIPAGDKHSSTGTSEGTWTCDKSRESLPEIPRESICPYGYDRNPTPSYTTLQSYSLIYLCCCSCYFRLCFTSLCFRSSLKVRSGPTQVLQRTFSDCWCKIYFTGRIIFLSPNHNTHIYNHSHSGIMKFLSLCSFHALY